MEIGIINYIKELESMGGDSNSSLSKTHNSGHISSTPKSVKNNTKRAYGLVVMTSPSHGGGRRFKSG